MRVFNTGSVPRAALTVWCNVLAAIAIIVLCTQLVSLRPSLAQDASALRPGEGFITRFSGAIQQDGETVINTGGSSGSIVDLRTPGQPPRGEHWWDEPQRAFVTAAQVGQVFGVAIDDDGNIYLTATAAFGLHRNAGNTGWMPGMWGREGGPGSIYKLDAAQNYAPSPLTSITLDGRENSGPALGNIAYDRWNKQLLVSDLETGMIHRISVADGSELGRYDHGVQGRINFTDAANGTAQSLPQVPFDTDSAARTGDCPDGTFAATPACWNIADFRRRVWGLGMRRDETSGQVRLYYSICGSQGFGNPDWVSSGEEQKNTVWSIALSQDGDFDAASVRREFTLPEFFTKAEDISRNGLSHPVTDIAFPALSGENTMVLAERGGLRNLGLNSENAFAEPHGARALRYELQADGTWQISGRYDIGYYDRRNEGQPYVRTNSSGGASFGYGYTAAHEADPARPDQWIWLTGDSLCSPDGLCFDASANEHSDASQVHGAQGTDQTNLSEVLPEPAMRPYPDTGYATPAETADQSAMVDADRNVDETDDGIDEELFRNDATRIGDIEIFQKAGPGGTATADVVPPVGPELEPEPGTVPSPEPGPGPLPPVAHEGFDLAMDKTGPAECERGEFCEFALRITNNGPDPYIGPLYIIEDLPVEIADYTVIPAAEWACERNAGILYCSHGAVTLARSESVDLRLGLRIPGDWVENEFRNCALIDWPLATGLTEHEINLRVEMALRLTGVAEYDPGVVDGTIDPLAQTAIQNYQTDNGLVVTGTVTEELRQSLFPEETSLFGDLNPANDRDCQTTPINRPQAVDLAVTKAAVGVCHRGDRCDFEVTVTNLGGAIYRGRVVVTDRVRSGAGGFGVPSNLVSLTDGWVCDAAMPGCVTDADVTLDPGVSIVHSVGTVIADDFAHDHLENCAELSWPAMADPGPEGDVNEDNDRGCATHVIERPEAWDETVDLAVSKSVRGVECRPGGNCDFMIEVQNEGTADYTGPVVIDDVATTLGGGAAVLPGSTVTAITPGWNCIVEGPGARCQHAGDLTLTASGPPIHFEVSVNLPADTVRNTLRNCGNIAWDEMPMAHDANVANDRGCVSRPIEQTVEPEPEPQLIDLAITALPPDPCRPGGTCDVIFTMTNNGPTRFDGQPVLHRRTLLIAPDGSEDLRFQAAVTEERVQLEPGASRNYTLFVEVPLGDAFHQARICETFLPEPSGVVEPATPEAVANNAVCVNFPIELERHKANLSISAGPIGVCRLGSPCNIAVTIRNLGNDPFVGELGVDGQILPAVRLRQVLATGPGWGCEVTGPGTYQCRHNPLTLAPGAKQSFRISAALPAALQADAITHSVNLVWVEGKVDSNSSDDTATVIIPLEQVAQPTETPAVTPTPFQPAQTVPPARQRIRCTNGAVSNGRCICRRGWIRQTVGPNRYRCVKPVVRIQCIDGAVRDGRCICRRDWTQRQLGPNRYRCVRPVAQIRCVNGKVDNRACVCPRNWTRTRTGRNAFRCVRPAARIQCTNGAVRNGKCVCPKGLTRRRLGTNRYRCIKPVVRIQCVNGAVRNGQCICREGWRRIRRGANRYTCIRPQARIRCSGGSVRNNRCVCPAGKIARRIGRNAYRCVWRAPD